MLGSFRLIHLAFSLQSRRFPPVACLQQAFVGLRGDPCIPTYALQRQASSLKAASNIFETSTGEPVERPRVDELVELGTFGPPHGLRGELRLWPISDSLEERLTEPGLRWAWKQSKWRNENIEEVKIEGIRQTLSKGKPMWLVKVEGIDSVEDAESLQSARLCMLASDRPALDDDDEFYTQELIGMEVILLTSGEAVGVVKDIYSGTGAHDLLLVELHGKGEASGASSTAYVPFAKEIVPEVDRQTRRLAIAPPEGLLDIPGLLRAGSSTPRKRPKQRPRS